MPLPARYPGPLPWTLKEEGPATPNRETPAGTSPYQLMATTAWLILDISLAAVFLAVTVAILAVGIRLQAGPIRRRTILGAPSYVASATPVTAVAVDLAARRAALARAGRQAEPAARQAA